MHFQLVSGDDLALILECSTVTQRISERLDAFEATHPIIGRLLVTVCAITGHATVACNTDLAFIHRNRRSAVDARLDGAQSDLLAQVS